MGKVGLYQRLDLAVHPMGESKFRQRLLPRADRAAAIAKLNVGNPRRDNELTKSNDQTT
jgi:hypothetical protein